MLLTNFLHSVNEPFGTEDGLTLAKQLAKTDQGELLKLGFKERRIAILPGYATQFLSQLLQLSLLRQSTIGRTLELEYGVFETSIRSKDERLSAFSPEICYFSVGTENFKFREPKEEAARWIQLCKMAHEWLGCSILMNTFDEPLVRTSGSFDFKWPGSEANHVREVNAILRKDAPSYIHFLDVGFLSSYYGRKNWQDEKVYDLYKLPCAFEYLAVYAEQLATSCSRIFGGSKKCVVLDLDRTLWGGVVGDDGLSGIQIGEDSPAGEAFKRFQTYLKGLKERGVLLAVCSKNEMESARDPFLKREEMVLKLEDFTCFIANWKPKSENIVTIAKTLKIGLDSIVFIDDNPAERKLVRSELPQVTVLDLPEDPSYFARALSEKNYFETVSVTEEDLTKTQMVRAEAQRSETVSKFSDYADYLRSLKMTAQVKPFDELHLPRIAQLINKTNQFNVTTRRYSETEVSTLMASPGMITRFVKLADQFGDHGLISAFIGRIEKQELVIDSWVMSCRVFQREVENLLFRDIVKEAVAKDLKAIRALYIPTSKNGVIKDLFEDLGFKKDHAFENGQSSWLLMIKKKEIEKEWISREIPIELSV